MESTSNQKLVANSNIAYGPHHSLVSHYRWDLLQGPTTPNRWFLPADQIVSVLGLRFERINGTDYSIYAMLTY